MRENTQLSFEFKMNSCKKVTADFSCGGVTSDAGVLVLREVCDRTGIIDHLANAISDRRHQRYVRHDLKTLLQQRVLSLACRYEDGNDADTLRFDPGFKAACDRLPSEDDLASQPTISRFENALTTRDIYRIAEVLIERFIASYKTRPERPFHHRFPKAGVVTLSFDTATVSATLFVYGRTRLFVPFLRVGRG